MESSKISSPQGTQPANAARSRSTAQGLDANSGAPTGFLALLAALGDAAEAGGVPVDMTAVPEVLPAAGNPADSTNTAADVAAIAAWQSLLPQPGNLHLDSAAAERSLGTPRVGGHEGAPGGLVAQAMDGQGQFAPLTGTLLSTDGLPQGLVAETATLDTSADVKGGLFPVSGSAQGKAFTRMQSALAQRADSAESAGARLRVGEAVLLPSQGHLTGAIAALQASSERMAGGLPGGATADHGGNGSAGAVLDGVGAVLAENLLAAVAPSGSANAAGGGSPRSGEGRAEGGAWFDSGSHLGVEPMATDNATVFTDPAHAGREDQVSEQVSYWINQKTQNAELTLNRDGQAVEVSVSLSGNEAHVTFRSDQPQTRELLDRSMAQLSELLRSEGLVLSGMSVGTSAGQRDGAADSERQGQPRQGARQAQVVAAAPVGTGSLLRGGSPDRAVDVFV